jgi:uncharacterized repeat protein (TIGR03803 family)
MSLQKVISVLIAVGGALSVSACGGQSVAVPGTEMQPTFAAQANESRPASLPIGTAPAQTSETILHSFAGGSDGAYPYAGLTNVNGVLYGTTSNGGGVCSLESGIGCGAVFSITTSGVESVLYSFAGGSDGASPWARLTNVNGVLYGTTTIGGDGSTVGSYGTVFKMTTSGAETVLHSFAGGSDGAVPDAGLTNVNGVLYGTTVAGGNGGCFDNTGCGTVFKITTAGAESVLYRFAGGSDGQEPQAGLTNVNGVLYGTTEASGAHDGGTVFKITTSGEESVLYSFAGGSDGASPRAGLTNVNGVLYGTTAFGGAHNDGTVFKVTTSGTESVLHSFSGGNDGADPRTDLIGVNGVLYGTTIGGGATGKTGTVFKITTSGAKTVLHVFAGSDGSGPWGSLTNVNGVLYGTTIEGGAGRKGIVFSLPL